MPLDLERPNEHRVVEESSSPSYYNRNSANRYLKLQTCKYKTGGTQKNKIPLLEVVIVQLEMTFISIHMVIYIRQLMGNDNIEL